MTLAGVYLSEQVCRKIALAYKSGSNNLCSILTLWSLCMRQILFMPLLYVCTTCVQCTQWGLC